MFIENGVSIKYLKETTTVKTYDTGLTDWENLDTLYRGRSLRNKVVLRTDITKYLTKYFMIETITKYRPVFMMIANGTITDPEKFSTIINELVNTDEVFAKEIVHLFHSCPDDYAFGVHIIESIADIFKNVESTFRSFFRGKPEVVICVSDGWLYFSVEDNYYTPELPDNIECEVLSHAKNWRGNFKLPE